jgi:hypothetical protein
MSSQLVAALLGAIVAFGGTYLLQRGRFRRAELEGVRERLGLTRALRANLYAAELQLEASIKNKVIPAGTTFPVALWDSHGHRLIGALRAPAEASLIDAFGRFAALNGLVNGIHRPGGHIDLDDDLLTEDHLLGLLAKVVTAIGMLDALEAENEQRERHLSHPIRARLLPEAQPK